MQISTFLVYKYCITRKTFMLFDSIHDSKLTVRLEIFLYHLYSEEHVFTYCIKSMNLL